MGSKIADVVNGVYNLENGESEGDITNLSC